MHKCSILPSRGVVKYPENTWIHMDGYDRSYSDILVNKQAAGHHAVSLMEITIICSG